MRKLLSIFLFFLLYSCGPISLEEDPVVQKHFSESEITYLDSILTFFDNEVIAQTPSHKTIQSYNELFQIIKDSVGTDPNTIPLEIDNQKLEQLFHNLPDSLSRNWYTDYSYTHSTGDSALFRDLSPFGQYGEFLKSASRKNDFIAEYYEDFINTRAISPSMFVRMLLFPEKLDIEKERERLIYAVHFITLWKPSAH